MLKQKPNTSLLSRKILTRLGRNYVELKSAESLSQGLYIDEPRLDLIQYVARRFCDGLVNSLENSLLWYLGTHYTVEELRRLPVSAISHLVDVRFIRDLDGGVGYEIRPKKFEYILHIPQED